MSTRGAERGLGGLRRCFLEIEACKLLCRACTQQSQERLPGIWRCQRASQSFQEMIYRQHPDGFIRSRLGQWEWIGAATVERYFRRGLER